MNAANTEIHQDLVLIGGGHTHALTLQMWAMQAMAGVRLTLISPNVQTPYSGMLPGLIAGHYNYDDTHIDLNTLCQFSNVRFIQAEVIGLDCSSQRIMLKNRPSISYDILSINSGITPNFSVNGADDYATPVKPIAEFYPKWQQLVKSVKHGDVVSVVGGGAAGVELVLAMHHALNGSSGETTVQLQLIHPGEGLPEGFPKRTQQHIQQQLNRANIIVHKQRRVSQVGKEQLLLTDEQGNTEQLTSTAVFWCTQAGAAAWPKASGLQCSERGFIETNDFLQSISHSNIFAVGDIAIQRDNPRPRAGVFAVRQAGTLFTNLRATLLSQTLKKHTPQTGFLSLLACGDKYATASRANKWFPSLQGRWVWRWKNRIDQRFMAKFKNLEPRQDMPVAVLDRRVIDGAHTTDETQMRCDGCAAKIPDHVLRSSLASLQINTTDDIVLGLANGDDCSAIKTRPNHLLIQSVDVFRALIDDPYLQGQIAAEHALSDLFAMNATPHSALAIVSLPFSSEKIIERDLQQLMQGATARLNHHNCSLIGGHSSEGLELSIGFTINGFADESLPLLQKGLAAANSKLILCKGLGTATLFAAHKQLKAKGQWIENAMQSMLQSNAKAGAILAGFNASACTDVTGFGLAGHLGELIARNCGAHIYLGLLPCLDGALDSLNQGIESSLANSNAKRQLSTDNDTLRKTARYRLLFDPQTSGGLLASVANKDADACLSALHKAGYTQASVIGETTSGNGITVLA